MSDLERFLAGEPIAVGTADLTTDAIIAFAEKYDPQRFHLSDESARQTHFGGLCASGWHTCGLWMRAFVGWTQTHAPGCYIVSPGFQNMTWPKPAYADQMIKAFVRVESWRESNRRDGSRILKTENWVEDADGDRVMACRTTILFGP